MKPKFVLQNIQFNSIHCGVVLEDIQLPRQCYLLGLVREGEMILTCNNPIVQEHDLLLAVAIAPSLAPELKVCLQQTHYVSWLRSHDHIISL